MQKNHQASQFAAMVFQRGDILHSSLHETFSVLKKKCCIFCSMAYIKMCFFPLGEGNDLIDEDADKARAYIVGRYDRVSLLI